jgi:hypothetical protein
VGPLPPWQYRGFESFPAFFFGANQSGPEPRTELSLVARHHFAGWGWQQYVDVTPGSDDGHYYSEETSLAQAATRLASYVAFAPPAPTTSRRRTQAIFVYRHSQMALSWYTVQRAAYADAANDDFWMKGPDGRTCVDRNRGGPAWNFSNPRAADFFVEEVVGELTREADINAVFFDETDSEYCGGDTCHGQLLAPSYYAAKIEVLRRTALKLNNHSIWPMFSSMNENVARGRCSLPYSAYFDALKDAGWIRFYEFFGVSSLENFLQEAASGLPVVVHAPGNMANHLALATFLLGQSNYTYFGERTVAVSCSNKRAPPQLTTDKHAPRDRVAQARATVGQTVGGSGIPSTTPSTECRWGPRRGTPVAGVASSAAARCSCERTARRQPSRHAHWRLTSREF